MIIASNFIERRSRIKLRSASYPPLPKTKKQNPTKLITLKKISFEFIASIIGDIKHLITTHRATKLNHKFYHSGLTSITAQHLYLQEIPKVRVELYFNTPNGKASILVKSKSGHKISSSQNNKSLKKAYN